VDVDFPSCDIVTLSNAITFAVSDDAVERIGINVGWRIKLVKVN